MSVTNLRGGVKMSAYEEYLEGVLEVKNKEIELYKNFIENTLKCRIRDEIHLIETLNNGKMSTTEFRTITIPETKYLIRNDSITLGGF
jgi:hypothetical protein